MNRSLRVAVAVIVISSISPGGSAGTDEPIMAESEAIAPVLRHDFYALTPPAPWVAGPWPDLVLPPVDPPATSGGALTTQDSTDPQAPRPILEPDDALRAPATKRPLVVAVDFSDVRHAESRSLDYYRSLLFGTAIGSMRHFYAENSYGQLTIEGSFVTDGGALLWARSAHPMAYYGEDAESSGSCGSKIDSKSGCVYELVREAVQLANPFIDFSAFDADGDEYIDHLIVIHAGGAQESSGVPSDIWSHRWAIRGGERVDGVLAYAYTLQAEGTPMGVFAHEFGHDLGLPDLYDTDYSSGGVGNWDVMGGGGWLNGGTTPSHFSAWSKIRLGWVTPIAQASSISGLSLPAVESSGAGIVKIAPRPANPKEYFLLENRQRTKYDAFLNGSGILIWHVDETRTTNSDDARRLVDLEQADTPASGIEDSGGGGLTAPWYQGNTAPGYEGIFGASTTPDSKFYDGTDSGVRIYDFGIMAATMKVSLDLGGQACLKQADVVIAIDTTGSMGGEIAAAKAAAKSIVERVRGTAPNTHFAIADFRDYPGVFSYPNYRATYGGSGDWPWKLRQDLTADVTRLQTAINAMSANGGADGPESYTRALWELTSNASVTAGPSWRAASLRVVVLVGDAPPHSETFFKPQTTGGDPGVDRVARSADDLSYETVVDQLRRDETVVHAIQAGSWSDATKSLQYVASKTGGRYVRLATSSQVADAMVSSIKDAVCEKLDFEVKPAHSLFGKSQEIELLIRLKTAGVTLDKSDVSVRASPEYAIGGAWDLNTTGEESLFRLVGLGPTGRAGTYTLTVGLSTRTGSASNTTNVATVDAEPLRILVIPAVPKDLWNETGKKPNHNYKGLDWFSRHSNEDFFNGLARITAAVGGATAADSYFFRLTGGRVAVDFTTVPRWLPLEGKTGSYTDFLDGGIQVGFVEAAITKVRSTPELGIRVDDFDGYVAVDPRTWVDADEAFGVHFFAESGTPPYGRYVSLATNYLKDSASPVDEGFWNERKAVQTLAHELSHLYDDRIHVSPSRTIHDDGVLVDWGLGDATGHGEWFSGPGVFYVKETLDTWPPHALPNAERLNAAKTSARAKQDLRSPTSITLPAVQATPGPQDGLAIKWKSPRFGGDEGCWLICWWQTEHTVHVAYWSAGDHEADWPVPQRVITDSFGKAVGVSDRRLMVWWSSESIPGKPDCVDVLSIGESTALGKNRCISGKDRRSLTSFPVVELVSSGADSAEVKLSWSKNSVVAIATPAGATSRVEVSVLSAFLPGQRVGMRVEDALSGARLADAELTADSVGVLPGPLEFSLATANAERSPLLVLVQSGNATAPWRALHTVYPIVLDGATSRAPLALGRDPSETGKGTDVTSVSIASYTFQAFASTAAPPDPAAEYALWIDADGDERTGNASVTPGQGAEFRIVSGAGDTTRFEKWNASGWTAVSGFAKSARSGVGVEFAFSSVPLGDIDAARAIVVVTNDSGVADIAPDTGIPLIGLEPTGIMLDSYSISPARGLNVTAYGLPPGPVELDVVNASGIVIASLSGEASAVGVRPRARLATDGFAEGAYSIRYGRITLGTFEVVTVSERHPTGAAAILGLSYTLPARMGGVTATRVDVTVHNGGALPSAAATLYLNLTGPLAPIAPVPIGPLAPGTSVVVPVLLKPVGAGFATVAPNLVKDATTISFEPRGIYIGNFSIDARLSSSVVSRGGTLSLTATVNNGGNVTFPVTMLSIHLDGRESPIATATLLSLARQTRTTTVFDISAASAHDVPRGAHTLVVRLSADSLLATAQVPVEILPETTPPTVTLVAPLDATTASGPLRLRALATDNWSSVANTTVQFLVEGAAGPPLTLAGKLNATSGRHEYDMDVSTIQNATVLTVRAFAYDEDGNEGRDVKPARVTVESAIVYEAWLRAGWNRLELPPLDPWDPRPASVLASLAGRFNVAWGYETGYGWKSYNPAAAAEGFPQSLASIVPGPSYWIHMVAGARFSLAAVPAPGGR